MTMVLHALHDAVQPLLAGKIGVLPTDTVYGVVARATDKAAVERLYALKSRERKPGTVIAASINQLATLGIDDQSLRRVAHLWPNPLSIVLPASNTVSYLHQGLNTLAVRIPDDNPLQSLLEQTGPLLTSSANQPGQPPAHTITDAQNYFHDQIDFYVNGSEHNRESSTVVILKDNKLAMLRPGLVEIDETKELL